MKLKQPVSKSHTKTALYEQVVVAGSGGQGILFTGKLLAQAAMVAGRQVTYMPSYGAEVRGGTANCMVVISDETIASPLVTEPDTIVIMNKASMLKFGRRVRSGGTLIINSSLVDDPSAASGVRLLAVPADELAAETGNQRIANMVAIGAYLEARGILDLETVVGCLAQMVPIRYHHLLQLNAAAMRRGAAYVRGLQDRH